MRYKIVIRRVQTAERHVRAADEEATAQKVQAELDRPYGFLGAWQTIDTDLDIAEGRIRCPVRRPSSPTKAVRSCSQ